MVNQPTADFFAECREMFSQVPCQVGWIVWRTGNPALNPTSEGHLAAVASHPILRMCRAHSGLPPALGDLRPASEKPSAGHEHRVEHMSHGAPPQVLG